MSIQSDCFTANMQVGVWIGQRLDRKTSAKVTKDASAHHDAARVNKHLVPRESLAEVTSCVSALRDHFYNASLPWKDNGDRLITRKSFQQFIVDHETLRDKFNAAVEDFIVNKYVTAKDQAEFRMGDLFEESDYPPDVIIRKKFYVLLDIDGVPEAKDFRLATDDNVLQARVTKAMQALWAKLSEPLEHFAGTVAQPDKVFRDTLVGNLKSVADALPAMNFTGDPDLTALGVAIQQRLTCYEPKELREDPLKRSAAAKEAADILAQMQGFMNTMGGDSDET